MIRTVFALSGREMLRFIRQPQRVAGTILQPLLFWLFLGFGMGSSFQPAGMGAISYLEYFYPGIIVMLLLFSGIFSSITIIEDRDAGFLQGVLIAPVSRLAIVLGKVSGGTIIALIQVLLFSLAAPFIGLTPSAGGVLMLLLGFILTGLGFTSLGFALAWTMKSTAGFHAIMMIFLIPLWMISGALFPMEGAPTWMGWAMFVNPVHHALNMIRLPFYHDASSLLVNGEWLISLAVTITWVVICLFLSIIRVNQREKGV